MGNLIKFDPHILFLSCVRVSVCSKKVHDMYPLQSNYPLPVCTIRVPPHRNFPAYP